jgi:hypothetical protein
MIKERIHFSMYSKPFFMRNPAQIPILNPLGSPYHPSLKTHFFVDALGEVV